MSAAAAADAAKERDEKKKDKDAGKRVSFTGLFRYADGTDALLILVGTVASLANGISQPLMTVIFGQVINAFGDATVDTVLSRVNEVSRLPVLAVYCRPPGQFLPSPCLSLANSLYHGSWSTSLDRGRLHCLGLSSDKACLDFWRHFRSQFPSSFLFSFVLEFFFSYESKKKLVASDGIEFSYESE